jgi:hypothetical protein
MTGLSPDTATADASLVASMIRPERLEKLPPCSGACLSGGEVRDWIGIVAQRRKLGLSEEEAFRQANVLSAVNPSPPRWESVPSLQAGNARRGWAGAVVHWSGFSVLGFGSAGALPRLEETGSRRVDRVIGGGGGRSPARWRRLPGDGVRRPLPGGCCTKVPSTDFEAMLGGDRAHPRSRGQVRLSCHRTVSR